MTTTTVGPPPIELFKVQAAAAPAAPTRSLQQRMDALAHANEIRTTRAHLKRDLKAGRESIRDLLLEPTSDLATAKVFDLLLACPKYGRVKVNKVFQQARISPSKTVGGLTRRQRLELVSLIRDTSTATTHHEEDLACAA